MPKPCCMLSSQDTGSQKNTGNAVQFLSVAIAQCCWPPPSYLATWDGEGGLSLPFDVWFASVPSFLHPNSKLRRKVCKQHTQKACDGPRLPQAWTFLPFLLFLGCLASCIRSSTALVDCPNSGHRRGDMKHFVQSRMMVWKSLQCVQLQSRELSQCRYRKDVLGHI